MRILILSILSINSAVLNSKKLTNKENEFYQFYQSIKKEKIYLHYLHTIKKEF